MTRGMAMQFHAILQTELTAALLQKTQDIIDGAIITEHQPNTEPNNDNLHYHLNNFFEIACKIQGFDKITTTAKLCEAVNVYFEALRVMESQYTSTKQSHNNRQVEFMTLVIFHNRIVREIGVFDDNLVGEILSNITNKYNDLDSREVQILLYIAEDSLKNQDLQQLKKLEILRKSQLPLEEILNLIGDGQHLSIQQGVDLVKNYVNYDPKRIVTYILETEKKEKDEDWKKNLSLLLLELAKTDPQIAKQILLLDDLAVSFTGNTEKIKNHKTLIIGLLTSQEILSDKDKAIFLIGLVSGNIVDQELRETITTVIHDLLFEENEIPVNIRCFLLINSTRNNFTNFRNDEQETMLTKIVGDLDLQKNVKEKRKILRDLINYKLVIPQDKYAKEIIRQILNGLPLAEELDVSEKLRILENLIDRKLINSRDENFKRSVYAILDRHLPEEKPYESIRKKIDLLESLNKKNLIDIHSEDCKETIRLLISQELISHRQSKIIDPNEFFITLKKLLRDDVFGVNDYGENLKQDIFAFLVDRGPIDNHYHFNQFFELFAPTNYEKDIIEPLNLLPRDEAKVSLCLSFLNYYNNLIDDKKTTDDQKNNAITNISNLLENEMVRNLFLRKKDFAKDLLGFIDRFSAKLPHSIESAKLESSNKKESEKHSFLENEKKLEQFPHILTLKKKLERVAKPSTITRLTGSLKMKRTESREH